MATDFYQLDGVGLPAAPGSAMKSLWLPKAVLDEELEKAAKRQKTQAKLARGRFFADRVADIAQPGAFFSDWNRLTGFNASGGMEKPADEPGFGFLRDSYARSAIDQIIINTRIWQIRQVGKRCLNPQRHAGWSIVHKCLTPDTEALTQRGWVRITDVQLTDKVATRNQSGKFIWQSPTSLHHYDYQGPMIHLHSRTLDLMVTPNHRVLVSPATQHGWGPDRIMSAQDTVGLSKRYGIPKTSEWRGRLRGKATYLNGTPIWMVNGTLPVPLMTWVAFLGIFLTEGHTTKHRPGRKKVYEVGVSQARHSPDWAAINDLLTRLPFRWTYRGHQWTAHDKNFWEELAPLGDAYRKYVPKVIKELPPQYLEELWKWAVIGDGTKHVYERTNQGCMVRSASRTVLDAIRNAQHPLTVLEIATQTGRGRRQTQAVLQRLSAKGVVRQTLFPNENNRARWAILDEGGLAVEPDFGTATSLTTVSVRMADDWQEILQKIGKSAAIRRMENHRIGDKIDGKIVKSRVPAYIVREHQSSHQTFNAEVVADYDGTVHCITVPNGIFYVRRNGYACWTGNSHDDPKFVETPAIKARAERVANVVAHPNPWVHPGGLVDVLSIMVREQLTVDRKSMVISRDRLRRPVARYWHLLDGTTVLPRLQVLYPWIAKHLTNPPPEAGYDEETIQSAIDAAITDVYEASGIDLTDAAYVQEIDSHITAAWLPNQLSIHVTQPSVVINKIPFGQGSLLQQSLDLTAGWVNFWQYNQSHFRTNYPEKALILQGEYDPNGLEAYKRKLFGEAGPASWERLLLMVGDEDSKATSVDLGAAPKDLMWDKMADMVIRLKSGVYRMDPSTFGWDSRSSESGIVFNPPNKEFQIAMAEEEGFHGLLQDLSTWITDTLVAPCDPDFVFLFDGLQRQQEKERVELSSQAVEHYLTIDEARAKENLEPLPEGIGKLPMWAAQAKLGAAQKAATPGLPGTGPKDALPGKDKRLPNDRPGKQASAVPVRKSLTITLLDEED